MNKLKLLKDCLTNKDYGKSKAKSHARFNHKSGKRGYNSNTWKDLCTMESYKVVE